MIGRNKTGTTSMQSLLETLGYRLGDQAAAERLVDDWVIRRFDRIIDYCRTADAFQDAPFSVDYTFQAVDMAFPGSRFILTIRASAEDWFRSLTEFHTRIVGKGRLPTADDLKAFPYREKGWIWRNQQVLFGIDEASLYDPEIYMAHYRNYNRTVQDYFRFRPDDLLVVNLSEADALERICGFLGHPVPLTGLPHLNRRQTVAS